MPGTSGKTGLKSTGFIQETQSKFIPVTPATTSTTTTHTTTTTTTTPPAALEITTLTGLPREPRLVFSEFMKKLSAEIDSRKNDPLIPTTEPQIPGLSEKSSDVVVEEIENPAIQSTHEEEQFEETDNDNDDDYETMHDSGEETEQPEIPRIPKENDPFSHLSTEQLYKLRTMWEREIRRRELPQNNETIILSQAGTGIQDTPPRNSFRPQRQTIPEEIETMDFGRDDRESTRHERLEAELEESSEEEDTGFLKICTEKTEKKQQKTNNPGERDFKAAKYLQTWNVRFANDGKDDPHEYLDDLAACQRANNLDDTVVLNALYGTFSGEAKLWFRNEQHSIETLTEFRKMFRKRFMKVATKERLEEDLKGRQQGPDEDIDTYMSCIKRILAEFKKPPSVEKTIKIIIRNLKDNYRRYIIDKRLSRLDDITKFGRELEKLEQWAKEERTQRPAKAMLVQSAAYRPKNTTSKIASVGENDDAQRSGETKKNSQQTNKNKPWMKKRDEKNNVAAAEQNKPPDKAQTYSQAVKNPGMSGHQEMMDALTKCLTEMGLNAQKPEAPGNPPANNSAAFQKPSGASTRNSEMQEKICYQCNKKGHLIYNCPERQCYTCGQMGHMSNNCPQKSKAQPKRNAESTAKKTYTPRCAWCQEPGVTVRTCPKYSIIYAALGNGAAGTQSPWGSS